MDGSAQSEYAHRTVSGLQGPRVNLTYRWVTQHAASCPLAGVVGCVLPSCVQGLVEPGSRRVGEGKGKIFGHLSGDWSSFCQSLCLSCWLALGFTSGGGIVTVVSVHPAQRCTSPLGVVPVGSGDGVGDCHEAANLLEKRPFISPQFLFCGKTMLFL